MDGTAKEVLPEDDVENEEGLDGVHVSAGGQGAELGSAIPRGEKWSKMMKEQRAEAKITALWRMAALMKMCPK